MKLSTISDIVDILLGFMFMAGGIDGRYSKPWINNTFIVLGGLIMVLTVINMILRKKTENR